MKRLSAKGLCKLAYLPLSVVQLAAREAVSLYENFARRT